jgi:hypothetical protein
MAANGDAKLHPSFFIERVPVDKQLPKRLNRYRQMSNEGWSLVVLLDLSDRRSMIAFGIREED